MTGVHISQVTDKTARALVSTDLIHGDGYHDRIWRHACILTRAGFGEYEYIGASSATLWRHEDGTGHKRHVVSVKNGVIDV